MLHQQSSLPHALFRKVVHRVDQTLATLQLNCVREATGLGTFLFHCLFHDLADAQKGDFDPQQGITIDMFRDFVRYFKEQFCAFVSPSQIVEGLDSGKKYVLLTFDDGYYNNIRALQVLEEFDVPATFFISTNHVRQGKSFWWDSVYRECRKKDWGWAQIQREIASYKRLRTCEIESRLKKSYGPNALVPTSDLDRPFTPSELKEFAAHPLVTIGNHTQDHAILTNYSVAEQTEQIRAAQDDIRAMCGLVPVIISYPNGNSSNEITELAQNCGLRLGVSCRGGQDRTPVDPSRMMSLKRNLIWGNYSISAQCKISRARVSLQRTLQSVKDHMRPLFAQ